MTTLSDVELLEEMSSGRLIVSPPVSHMDLQPASLDVCMGDQIKMQVLPSALTADYWECRPSNPPVFSERNITDAGVLLYPNEFYLGTTREYFEVPDNLAIKLEGKSSWGRCGLLVHSTAGWIDPGFQGQITFEMKVIGMAPVRVYAGDRIAQVCASRLGRPAARPYGHPELNSHYQGQIGPTAPRGGN